MNDISFFTSQPKSKFYDILFSHLNLDSIPDRNCKFGRKGFSKRAMLCAVIVMKCECFAYITDLVDFLHNNLLIAYYCGFDITKKLPQYHAFERFIKNFDNNFLKELMSSQVKKLYDLGILEASFIAIDSTPISANTTFNNPKSFSPEKFTPEHRPNNDLDCKLGVHTASNQHNEKKFEFFWGYKSHVVLDCISGLPLYELTTTANLSDNSVALQVLHNTNKTIPLENCTLIADKGYDIKAIYNTVKTLYSGNCVIPLNPRNKKEPKMLSTGNIICDAGFAMHKDGKYFSEGRYRQKYCCPFKTSKDDSACICSHRNYFNGKKYRGCTKYVTLPHDERLSIDRSCISFKKIYALRTEIERYNARFKKTGQERMWVRSFNATQNLSSVAHIALLAVATVAILSNKAHLKNSPKAFMRAA